MWEDKRKLMPLRCPFCGVTILTIQSYLTKKERRCYNCKRCFFYHRRRYYISIDDMEYLKKVRI